MSCIDNLNKSKKSKVFDKNESYDKLHVLGLCIVYHKSWTDNTSKFFFSTDKFEVPSKSIVFRDCRISVVLCARKF